MRSNWGHFEIGWIVHLEHWRGSWGENQLFTPKIRSFRGPKCWLLLNRLLDMYVDISKKKNADHGISVLLQASQYNNVEFQVHSQDFLMSLVLEVFAELKILVVKWCPTGFLQTFHQTKHCSPCLSVSLLNFSCFLFKIKIFPFPCKIFLDVDLIFGNELNSLKKNSTESDGKFCTFTVFHVFSAETTVLWKAEERGIEGCSHALRLVPVSWIYNIISKITSKTDSWCRWHGSFFQYLEMTNTNTETHNRAKILSASHPWSLFWFICSYFVLLLSKS